MNTLKKKNGFVSEITSKRQLYIMLAPMLLYFFIFHYLPMVGHALAFQEYRYDTGIFRSPFIGVEAGHEARNWKFDAR